MNLQPYQQASEEVKRQSRAPIDLAGNVASLLPYSSAIKGAGIAGGAALLKKVLPFLSKYIPQALAIQGMKKVAPKIGEFVETSISQGHQFDDVSNFIKEKSGVKGEDFAQENEQQPQQGQQQKMSVGDQEAQRFQEYYGQKQNNQSDAALMEVLNKILTM